MKLTSALVLGLSLWTAHAKEVKMVGILLHLQKNYLLTQYRTNQKRVAITALVSIFDAQLRHKAYSIGMYNRKTWGGPVDPFILVKFLNKSVPAEPKDPIASMVIFEWNDLDLVGVPSPNGGPNVRCGFRCAATQLLTE